MSDGRSPDLPSVKIIRPGHRMGPKPEGPKISWTSCSSLGAFLICPQFHGFGYEMGLRPTEDKEALILGSLIHVGLAYHYGMRMNPRPAWMVYPSPEAPDPRVAIWTCGQDNLDIAEKALRIFDAYTAFYNVPTLQPVLIEHQFDSIMDIDGVPEKYTLRIDLLARDMAAGGELVLLDHKCLPIDSVVLTDTGPRTVGSLLDVPSWRACAFDNGRLGFQSALQPRANGVQDVYSVKLRGGLVGRYGWNHPLLTSNGFVRASEVKVGDLVATAAQLPDVQDVPIPDPLIPVAAMLISDGGFTSGTGVTYTKGYGPFRNYFIGCLRELGMTRAPGGGPDHYRVNPARAGKVASVSMTKTARPIQALYALGLKNTLSAVKRIPQSLLGLSRRQVGLLVGGFWSGDGAMYLVKERKRGKLVAEKVRIVYGSRSYGLCCDIRHLLNQLGLICTVTSSSVLYKGKRRGYYFTTVVGRASKTKFLEMVCSGEIRRPNGASVAKRLLVKLAATAEPPESWRNPRLDRDVYWDRVESVLFAGREPTYDIEVPGPATFVADGIVTHNSIYKFTKWVGMDYRTDREMLTGLALSRAAGYDVKRVIINGIQKGTKENPTPRFQRFDVPVSADAYARLGGDIVHAIRTMRYTKQAYPDPTNRPRVTESCVRKYGRCQFYPVCADGPNNLVQFTRKW